MTGPAPAPPPAGLPGLASALAEREDLLSHCVHCGFCLPACPTYQELGDEADSPRGRLHLMRAVVEGRLEAADEAFQRHLDRCLGCRACETVCPSGVEYGLLLERARAVASEARPGRGISGWATRLLLATMATPLLRRLFGAGGRVLRATGLPGRLAGLGRGWTWARAPRLALGMLAASAPVSLSSRSPGPVAAEGLDAPRPPGSAGRVALLRGCVQAELFERVHRATRRVLEVNGWEVVDVDGQGCCGALHAHAGDLEGARHLASANLRAFREPSLDAVVTNAAGCGALLRELHELLPGDSGAQRLARLTRDVSVLVAGEGRVPVRGAPLPLQVVYDPPCHLLHAQRVADPPRRMLEAIPGLDLLPLADADRCCGGAGIYGLTHPELGGDIGDAKVRAIVESGAHCVATGNPGCQMQIGAGLRMSGHPIDVLHPVELLAESYRRAGWGSS